MKRGFGTYTAWPTSLLVPDNAPDIPSSYVRIYVTLVLYIEDAITVMFVLWFMWTSFLLSINKKLKKKKKTVLLFLPSQLSFSS